MKATSRPLKNPESLLGLGKQMRQHRELAGIAQGRVRGMRQATVSKIENGGDVTLDTFVSYAASLGLELALVPAGQAQGLALRQAMRLDARPAVDLLSEFSDLKDEE